MAKSLESLLATCLLMLSLGISVSRADNKDIIFRHHLHQVLEKKIKAIDRESAAAGAGTFASTIDQKLDHFNKADGRTFKQRYYLNSDFATGPNSPVLFVMCGEGECSAAEIEEDVVASYARKLGAHRIALEHRYYGQSQPFLDLSSEHLKYLSTSQALEDLAQFQNFAKVAQNLKGPWVTIGGSYSGSLSAYYRLTHPNLVAGALASSAPVMAKENFEEYDLQVSKVVGPVCAAAMRQVVSTLESALNDPAKMLAYKKMFSAETVSANDDFLFVVADMGAVAVQYGNSKYFCDTLTASPDPVQGYAIAGVKLFQDFGITPFDDSAQAAMNIKLNSSSFGMRQWYYQTCTEYGYFQVAYHDPAVSVRSQLVNLDMNHQICKKLFGTPPLDTSIINKKLYGPLLDLTKASKIFFTNGSNDPWSNLSITARNGNTSNPATFNFLIDGGSHCEDLEGVYPSGPVADAQSMFYSLMETWLK